MRSSTGLVWGVFLVVTIAFVVEAQVNFSPAWGKRGQSMPMTTPTRDAQDHFSTSLGDCKLPFDGVVRILKLIQIEAQRVLRCEGMPPESAD